ncbi:MAG TPA: glycosyltransferase family 1 protein, partial [Chloroflexota bacterium]|nr:glycosyltransferase family 1 protein [Chloroflexota bacterium]
MLRVAVMGRSIRPRPSGVGRHAANLVSGLADILPTGSLNVFLTRDAPRLSSAKVREIRAPFPTPNEYARAFWEQTLVPAQSVALGVDVYHSPNYILPAALSRPSVVTIHDLTFLQAALHRLTSHLYLSALTALAIHRARAIIAVSAWTRDAIVSRYPEVADRIEVIYQGLDPDFRRPSPDELERFRDRLGWLGPYVLFVGTLEPRKNVARLIAAYERAVEAAGLPHHLVLIGARGWKTEEIDHAVSHSPLRQRIHRIGYVSEEELPLWYAAADLFVYPSLLEGFGLPPLEAMASGTPVITSNCSALPEVVGDAAVTVSPDDTGALSSAIVRVLLDPLFADSLRQAGLRRAQLFTWSEAARRHVALYERITSGG